MKKNERKRIRDGCGAPMRATEKAHGDSSKRRARREVVLMTETNQNYQMMNTGLHEASFEIGQTKSDGIARLLSGSLIGNYREDR